MISKDDLAFLKELALSYWRNGFFYSYTNVQYSNELREKGKRLDEIIEKLEDKRKVKVTGVHISGMRKKFYSMEEVQEYFDCTAVTVYNILKKGEFVKQGKFKNWKLVKGEAVK